MWSTSWLVLGVVLMGGVVMSGQSPQAEPTPAQVAELRGATARFHRFQAAVDEGYTSFGPCFASPEGGMGFHFANEALKEDAEIDASRPELLMYVQDDRGGLRFVGVEYIVFKARWLAAGHAGPPVLFGRTFAENPTLLDEPFYFLHAWTALHNPSGLFADWNPRVSCPAQ